VVKREGSTPCDVDHTSQNADSITHYFVSRYHFLHTICSKNQTQTSNLRRFCRGLIFAWIDKTYFWLAGLLGCHFQVTSFSARWTQTTEVIERVMTRTGSGHFIFGITKNGNKFRPSDWVERIATVFASFDANHRLRYDPKVRPVCYDELPCLFVDGTLAIDNPAGCKFIM
jgi:hypothetical protein